MELIKTNIPGLLKDQKTRLIINNDENDFNRAKMAREQTKELSILKADVEIIKKQLKIITEKINE